MPNAGVSYYGKGDLIGCELDLLIPTRPWSKC